MFWRNGNVNKNAWICQRKKKAEKEDISQDKQWSTQNNTEISGKKTEGVENTEITVGTKTGEGEQGLRGQLEKQLISNSANVNI